MTWPRVDRLSWKLGISVAAIVVVGQTCAFLLVYRHSSENLLAAARDHALLETVLIRRALEHRMLEKDDRLIKQLIESFVTDRAFERVMILNRQGEVRITSDPSIQEQHFNLESPTCQVCHQYPGDRRELSTTLSIDGGTVLRCVEPIPNREECHECHDPEHRLNGLVIVDVPLSATLDELEESVVYLGIGTSGIGLLLLGGIGLVFRRLVLRRLVRFQSAARALGDGDLERRVPVEGDDALTRVEQQFNEMAGSIARLLGEVRQQSANLERVMNSVDDGLVVLDRERNIVAANEAFWNRFSSAARLGSRCCGAAPDGIGCVDEGPCPTAACFGSGQVEMVVRTRSLPDGGTRQEEVRASPVFSTAGTTQHVVEVWRDITDRRAAEARLADHERMVSLGRLASGFSHEVNTPLASIGTCLDGITRVCASDTGLTPELLSQIKEYAHVASTQVQRCGAITEQFLRLARGKSLGTEIIDLPRCAASVARLCNHVAEEAGVTIDVDVAASVASVVASEPAVQQVLLNLLMNAIAACGPGDSVKMRFHQDDDAITATVRDPGKGIPLGDLGRVFEPFYTSRAGGTGLGLFVSLNLARSWGGDIGVVSTTAEGTMFTVRFPHAHREEADG